MVGDMLKERRKLHGYTQRQLGELLGYEGRTAEMMVQKWEYNQRPINPKHYRKLAELLDMPVEAFIP